MVKKKFLLTALAVLMCIAGTASVFLVHYAEKRDKADAAEETAFTNKLVGMIRNVEITIPMLRFDEKTPPKFGEVLDYFRYEGFHSAESFKGPGVLKTDLLGEYFDAESGLYKVPVDIVEGLVCSRFNVSADRESVAKDNPERVCDSYYDSGENVYVFSADSELLYNIAITERKETEPGIFDITVTKDTAVENYAVLPVYKEYRISVNGDDFKFLSVSDHVTKNTAAEPSDRDFRQIAANYAVSCENQFALGEDVKYADIFSYFMFEGCMDVNEDRVKNEMLAYCTSDGNKSSGTEFSVPADIADKFLSERFNVTPDKESVECYNSETDTYDFTALNADRLHYYNIVDKSRISANTYVIYVMQKAYNDVTGFSDAFYRFVIEVSGSKFKYLSVSSLYDPDKDAGLYPVALEKEEYYSILEKSPLEFEYVIYDKNGNEAARESLGNVYPRLKMTDNDTVCITVTRSGEPAVYKYYSVSRNEFSGDYSYVYCFGDEKAAYVTGVGENTVIVVENVFDSAAFKKEIPFSREFPPAAALPTDCVISMEFTEDGDLKVTYAKGENYTTEEEIIDLG